MRSSIRLFRVAGIQIGIHFTWLIALALITWSLAANLFPVTMVGLSTLTYWVMGLVAALLLFVSVLLHELAHSLVARGHGMKVDSITLFILGGVSNLSEEPKDPGIEFQMSIAGPLSSLIIGIICWAAVSLIQMKIVALNAIYNVGSLNTPLETILGYLAFINVLLAAFNLIPGFPLDGGRVLRSIIWGSTRNLRKATNIASSIGQVFGWAMIGAGVYLVFLPGGFISGIWIAFIGWFLTSAAESSRQEVALHEKLAGIKVKQVMNPDQRTISPQTTVQELVESIFRKQYGRAVPVCDGGNLVGIVTIADVKGLPSDRWPQTSVAGIMTKTPLYTVKPDDDLNVALTLIAGKDVNQVLVITEGQCAGTVSRADIISYLQLKADLAGKRV